MDGQFAILVKIVPQPDGKFTVYAGNHTAKDLTRTVACAVAESKFHEQIDAWQAKEA